MNLPPTDTLSGHSQAPSSEGWRLILLVMAGTLAIVLLLMPESVVKKKDR